jgi:predicted ATPase
MVAALRDRQLVLVLDGCEAVLDDVRALATELLNRCPGVRLLVTSRSVLDLPSERRQPVAPLGLPPPGVTRVADVLDAPAVRLLLERARARDPDFAVTQSTAPHAAAVVRRVDGLPLAVELAAARLTVLSLPELAAGLEDRLSLLVSRSRVEEPRRRSLRATLDWSWDLLDEEQRGAWCALAVPADDVDLTLAGALISAAGCRRPAVDLVQDLVERSLLTAVTSSSPTQYRMLGSLREYGAERLAQLQRSAAVHERYARWVDEQAVAAAGTWDPMCFDVDLDALERVLPHARQVLASAGDGAAGARAERIAGALGWLWFLRGMATEGLEWLDRYGPAGSPAAQCDPNAATWALGLKATGAGGVQHPPAPHSAEERGAPGPTEPARAVLDAVFAALTRAHRGDLTGADRDLDAAVTSASSVGGWPHGVALLLRAQLTRLTGGQPSTADLRHAVHLLTDARATWAHAYCLDLLVDDLVHQGKVATAMSLALEGLDLCRTERLPGLEVRMLVHLATLTHRRGETALSRSHTASALSLTASLGDPVSAGYTYLSAAAIAEERGDLAEAVHHLHDSLAAFGDAPAGAYGATQAREALTRITAMGHSALDRPSRLLT